MRRLAVLITFLSVACLLPKNADAQVVGPFVVQGPSLELDLPPLLRVRIGPAPVVRLPGPRVRVVQMAPPPPPPPPQAPPPPPVRVYVVTPKAAPPPPPPPPVRRRVYRRRYRRRHHRPRRRTYYSQRIGLTIGGFVDTAMYEKGQLVGAGLNLRWRFARHWALTGSFSGMGSCTHCNEDIDAGRADFNWTVGVMYLLFPRYWITPYVRGAVAFNHANFHLGDEKWRVSQAGAEFGVGLEWRVTQWLALVADANVLALGEMSATDDGGNKIEGAVVPSAGTEETWKGIPRSEGDDVAARLRFGVVVKF